MRDLTVIFKSENQRTEFCLNYEFRMIEEVTIYLQKDGNALKSTLEREIYSDDTNLKCMQIFFNSKLNALKDFYKTQGEFKMELYNEE